MHPKLRRLLLLGAVEKRLLLQGIPRGRQEDGILSF